MPDSTVEPLEPKWARRPRMFDAVHLRDWLAANYPDEDPTQFLANLRLTLPMVILSLNEEWESIGLLGASLTYCPEWQPYHSQSYLRLREWAKAAITSWRHANGFIPDGPSGPGSILPLRAAYGIILSYLTPLIGNGMEGRIRCSDCLDVVALAWTSTSFPTTCPTCGIPWSHLRYTPLTESDPIPSLPDKE